MKFVDDDDDDVPSRRSHRPPSRLGRGHWPTLGARHASPRVQTRCTINVTDSQFYTRPICCLKSTIYANMSQSEIWSCQQIPFARTTYCTSQFLWPFTLTNETAFRAADCVEISLVVHETDRDRNSAVLVFGLWYWSRLFLRPINNWNLLPM